MRIAILTRNRNLHSTQRLLQEGAKAGIHFDTVNPLDCQLIVAGKQSHIVCGQVRLPEYDAILPRIGASITDYGLAVVKQFEALGTFTVNSSQAIAQSRDKMRCLQVLSQAGLQVPPTVLSRTQRGVRSALQAVNGLPVVLKLLQGTQGVGVMLVHSDVSLASVLDTLWGLEKDVLIQQFIAEAAGQDFRALVIGNRVVAAMMRTAPKGEFRTNIHRGGEGSLVRLPKRFEGAAIRAAGALGLQIAGVDLMESRSGPMILEVNSSPGFEGIEKATGRNIAGAIVRHIVTSASRAKAKARARQTRARANRARRRRG